MHRLDAAKGPAVIPGWRLKVAAATIVAVAGCGTVDPVPQAVPPLQAIPKLELQRFLGTWYQVAWFPNAFNAPV